MDRLLLHICCAPCSAYAVPAFRSIAGDLAGFFFNPNIQPAAEYLRRREALESYAATLGVPVTYDSQCRPGVFEREVASSGEDRCRCCYALRLRETAREAARRGCDAYSTTLLFSIYQKHDQIREVGEEVAREVGVPFLYRDLRPGWRRGSELYRKTGLYRQRYCGCAFSERERRERARAGVAPAGARGTA